MADRGLRPGFFGNDAYELEWHVNVVISTGQRLGEAGIQTGDLNGGQKSWNGRWSPRPDLYVFTSTEAE